MTTRFTHGVSAPVLASSATIQSSPFGHVYYVDTTNGLDSNNGSSPTSAFKTIGQAISSGAAGDTIIIAPGTYTITAALVPKARQTFQAAIINARYPTVSITSSLADTVQVDVSGCAFIGIEFLAGADACANLVDVADGGVVNGCVFDRCVFNGADKASVDGLNLTDASNATTGLVVTECLFRDLTGTCIDVGALGMPYAYIGYSQFAIDVNSGTGIALADTGAFATGKGYVIEHNTFTGFDATGDEVGITIAGTENTTGAGIIRNNYFAYCGGAAAITIDKLSPSELNNYYASATVGGVLVGVGS